MAVTWETANDFGWWQKGCVASTRRPAHMPRSNQGLLLAGCAAVAVGVMTGWTALTMMPSQTSPIEAPGGTVSSEPSPVSQPAADNGSPSQPAIAQPAPPAAAKEPAAV